MVGPMKVAIIGAAGGIADSHIHASAETGTTIVGMSDIPAAAERGQKRAASANCPFFTDHREMLAKTKPDVAAIVTPHPFHADLAVDAFAAGCHVLTEKPMAVSVGDADRMIAAAEKAGKLLAVNFQKRYWVGTERARAMVDAGEVGELIRVLCLEPWYRTEAYYQSASWRGTWKGEGGGVLMNQAPHTMDLLCHLAGMPKRVWGWVRRRYHRMECEDSAQAMFEFPNGAPGYLTVSTVEAGVPMRLQVIGSKGGFEIVGGDLYRLTFAEPLLDFMRTSQEMWSGPGVTYEKVELKGAGGGHNDVYRDLKAAVEAGGRPMRVSGRESLMSLELANGIVLSSFTDRAIPLPVDRAAYGALLTDLRNGTKKL